ncbi:hypothetical protein Pelo_19151 [Pelomyxa schiedti]|nr:hypothetical protein Pelo_19151 [Pelomyxa schiedti]
MNSTIHSAQPSACAPIIIAHVIRECSSYLTSLAHVLVQFPFPSPGTSVQVSGNGNSVNNMQVHSPGGVFIMVYTALGTSRGGMQTSASENPPNTRVVEEKNDACQMQITLQFDETPSERELEKRQQHKIPD